MPRDPWLPFDPKLYGKGGSRVTGVSANPNTEREKEQWLADLRVYLGRKADSNSETELSGKECYELLADRDLLARALRLASEEIAERRTAMLNAATDGLYGTVSPDAVLAGLLREAAKS